MKRMAEALRYDISRTYDWNYANAPSPSVETAPAAVPGDWSFCGLPVDSPVGVPAGPLLNSDWILYYARLGFDTLTYKTVRSSFRACYEPPNLAPVAVPELRDPDSEIVLAPEGAAYDTWAISFGMPSKTPADWRADVECARRGLAKGQVLSVSVVASPAADWSMAQVAEDFARCAGWAEEAGAQVVEANLSCPNVCTKETDLYLDADAAAEVASAVRAAVKVPVALKIGLFPDTETAEQVVRAVAPHVDALSSANSITAKVRSRDGEPLFGGLRRGIGGAAITRRCEEEMRMLSGLVREIGADLDLIGVGGVTTAADVRARLAAGAGHVHLATAPMIDPLVGLRIRKELAQP